MVTLDNLYRMAMSVTNSDVCKILSISFHLMCVCVCCESCITIREIRLVRWRSKSESNEEDFRMWCVTGVWSVWCANCMSYVSERRYRMYPHSMGKERKSQLSTQIVKSSKTRSKRTFRWHTSSRPFRLRQLRLRLQPKSCARIHTPTHVLTHVLTQLLTLTTCIY